MIWAGGLDLRIGPPEMPADAVGAVLPEAGL